MTGVEWQQVYAELTEAGYLGNNRLTVDGPTLFHPDRRWRRPEAPPRGVIASSILKFFPIVDGPAHDFGDLIWVGQGA